MPVNDQCLEPLTGLENGCPAHMPFNCILFILKLGCVRTPSSKWPQPNLEITQETKITPGAIIALMPTIETITIQCLGKLYGVAQFVSVNTAMVANSIKLISQDQFHNWNTIVMENGPFFSTRVELKGLLCYAKPLPLFEKKKKAKFLETKMNPYSINSK